MNKDSKINLSEKGGRFDGRKTMTIFCKEIEKGIIYSI